MDNTEFAGASLHADGAQASFPFNQKFQNNGAVLYLHPDFYRMGSQSLHHLAAVGNDRFHHFSPASGPLKSVALLFKGDAEGLHFFDATENLSETSGDPALVGQASSCLSYLFFPGGNIVLRKGTS